MRSVLGIFACVLAIGLVACGEPQEEGITIVFDDEAEGVISHALVHGSADTIGLLNFLNDESTTFEVLDIDARLDKRSAAGLIHRRNGPDGEFGTWDDNLFKSADEVDAVKWVGPRAMDRILSFAGDHGFIPAGDDLLGVYDRVSFTVIEADAVVNAANELSYDALDELLNRRTANSIVENRPFASMAELADTYYVGRKALTVLKETVAKPGAAIAQQR